MRSYAFYFLYITVFIGLTVHNLFAYYKGIKTFLILQTFFKLYFFKGFCFGLPYLLITKVLNLF